MDRSPYMLAVKCQYAAYGRKTAFGSRENARTISETCFLLFVSADGGQNYGAEMILRSQTNSMTWLDLVA